MTSNEWKRITFPFDPKIIYVVKIRKETEIKPIYVGMSETRNIGRFGDYVSCQFSATADFKVGVAARHLASKGYEIMIDYRSSCISQVHTIVHVRFSPFNRPLRSRVRE